MLGDFQSSFLGDGFDYQTIEDKVPVDCLNQYLITSSFLDLNHYSSLHPALKLGLLFYKLTPEARNKIRQDLNFHDKKFVNIFKKVLSLWDQELSSIKDLGIKVVRKQQFSSHVLGIIVSKVFNPKLIDCLLDYSKSTDDFDFIFVKYIHGIFLDQKNKHFPGFSYDDKVLSLLKKSKDSTSFLKTIKEKYNISNLENHLDSWKKSNVESNPFIHRGYPISIVGKKTSFLIKKELLPYGVYKKTTAVYICSSEFAPVLWLEGSRFKRNTKKNLEEVLISINEIIKSIIRNKTLTNWQCKFLMKRESDFPTVCRKLSFLAWKKGLVYEDFQKDFVKTNPLEVPSEWIHLSENYITDISVNKIKRVHSFRYGEKLYTLSDCLTLLRKRRIMELETKGQLKGIFQ